MLAAARTWARCIIRPSSALARAISSMAQDVEYDLVTIGAGSGGTRASRFAAQLYGAKVAVVELPFGFVSSGDVGGAGGTCVIRGCVPKKLLVYAAAFRDEFADAEGFGWLGAAPPHDWKRLIAAKAKEIERLNGVYVNLLKGAGVDYFEGRGSLVDAHTVRVVAPDGAARTLRAKHVLIATGGYATRLGIPGAEHAITSDEALALESLPSSGSALIVGSGYIAVEFAGIFAGLGVDTHLMYRADAPLRGFDEECRAQVGDNLAKRGITLHAGELPTAIEKLPGGGGYRVTAAPARGGGAPRTFDVGLVMMATGRKPRTQGLGIEALGIETEQAGAIKVDELSATNVKGVWAIGDVTNRINLTPVALMEGMALAKTLFGGEPTKPDYQFVASAVFCQPPLASVGYSEEEAIAKLAGPIDVYVSKFRPMKGTISGREERTLMKLLVAAESDRVIGCHMVGPDAAEIMQGLAIAVKCGATKRQFDSTVGIHPSAAEEFVTMRTRTRRVEGKGTLVL